MWVAIARFLAAGSWFWRQAVGVWEDRSCPGWRLLKVVKIWVSGLESAGVKVIE